MNCSFHAAEGELEPSLPRSVLLHACKTRGFQKRERKNWELA